MIDFPAVKFPVAFDGVGLVDADGKKVDAAIDLAEVARRANAYDGYVTVIKALTKKRAKKLKLVAPW